MVNGPRCFKEAAYQNEYSPEFTAFATTSAVFPASAGKMRSVAQRRRRPGQLWRRSSSPFDPGREAQ
jgi:hypothetical protein